MPDAVLIFLRDPETGQNLFMRRAKPAEWAGLMTGVSGKQDKTETPMESAIRVIHDNTDMVLIPSDLQVAAYLRQGTRTVTVFRGYHPLFGVRKRTDDHPILLPRDAPLQHEPLVPNLRWLLPVVWSESILLPAEFNLKV